MTLRVRSRSPASTEALGRALGAVLRPGDVVRLCGDLGAGKTRFVKGIAAGMGAAAADEVVSPTFLRLEEYGPPGRRLRHVDAYRMTGGAELESLGAGEVFAADGVAVVEWPERVEEALPRGGLRIALTPTGPRAREIVVEALDGRGVALMAALLLDPAVRRRRVRP